MAIFVSVTVAFAVSLLVCELGARAYVRHQGIGRQELLLEQASLYLPDSELMYRYRPGARCRQFYGGSLRINSLGFRGPEISAQKRVGCVRVVCVGGSTTASNKVADDMTYPSLLGEFLRIRNPDIDLEVINAGVPGYNSAQSLRNLNRRLLNLSPDVLVVYHAINDVIPRLAPGFQQDYSHHQRPLKFEKSTVMQWLTEYSTLVALSHYRWYRSRVGLTHLTHRNVAPMSVARQFENFQSTTAEAFRRNINAIVHVAKSREIDVVLSTFVVDPVRMKDEERQRHRSYSAYRAGVAEHNEVMRDIAEKNGLVLVDVCSAFPEDSDAFYDAVHLNSRGTTIKARLFAEAIQTSGLLESRVASQRK